MRLKKILWSTAASRSYLPLLTRQRQAIDALLRGLREAAVPGPPFRAIDEHPGYWFARTETDLIVVVRKRSDDCEVIGFADWQRQFGQALEEAAAALAAADSASSLAA